MKKYTAQIASEGVAYGKIKEYIEPKTNIIKECVDDVDAELIRLENAKQAALEQIEKMCLHADTDIGKINTSVFETHMFLIKDLGYSRKMVKIINTEKANAEYAVATVTDDYIHIFENMEDDYFKERAADMRDIGKRILSVLQKKDNQKIVIDEECILLADDLSPSQTLQMDKSKVLAIVIRNGSINSHAAILARAMDIPALIGANIPRNVEGTEVIVDACNGVMYLNPTQKSTDKIKEQQENISKEKKEYSKYKGLPAITKSGKKIKLFANVGGLADVLAAVQNGACGIGLFRTEFIFLEHDDFPSEETQFDLYKKAAQISQNMPIVIRTLDIGADKVLPYFKLEHELNPALGMRGVRVYLKYKNIFKTQVRAIIRASVYGKISILLPMVTDVKEIRKIKKFIEEVKTELDDENIRYGEFGLGVMIETPASVMIAEEIAAEVDFLSIGTNDLTQYTLALDRENPKLHVHKNLHHPAIFRMIKMVVDAAAKHGKIVGICGELASDTSLTETFISYGINQLSVSPHRILPLTKVVRELE